jgi:hypothetical protein
LLADVLGRSYGLRIEIGGKNAFTNGRVIRLPSLPMEGDSNFLNLVRGYIDHEAAHIRYTDFTVLAQAELSALEQHVWNCLEDWRVERELASHFPGCRVNFEWLIGHIFVDTADPVGGSPQDVWLEWLLSVIRRWSVPALDARSYAYALVLDREWPGLTVQIGAILSEARSHCPDTSTCVDYARRIVACLHSQQGLDPLLSQQVFPLDLGEVLQKMVMERAEQIGRCGVAKPGTKPLTPATGEDMVSIGRATAGLKARLHGLLQASRLTRSRPSRRGKLNTRKLHGIVTSDPRLFLSEGRRPALNTAVHILLDSSTSMRSHMETACRCCLALGQALDIQGISTGLTAFPGSQPDTVVPILEHGRKRQSAVTVQAKGGTPLGEAIWWVLQRMVTLPEDRKLLLIVTDGDPDNLAVAQDAIRAACMVGVEVLGLGIEAPAILKLLPDRSAVIEHIDDLPKAVFSLLEHSLVPQGRDKR